MTMRMQRLAVTHLLASIALAASVAASSNGAQAQIPPAPKESELVAAGRRQLTGPEIVRMVVGNTAYAVALDDIGDIKRGGVMKIFYRDSKTRIQVPSAGPLAGKKFETNWWLEGNLHCAEQRLGIQRNSCSSWYSVDSSIYTCGKDAGICRVLLRFVPGNPDNI